MRSRDRNGRTPGTIRAAKLRRPTSRALWLAACIALAIGPTADIRAAGFQGLGLIGATAAGVSGDGIVVIGSGYAGPNCTGTEGWRWTSAAGVTAMGCLPGGAESRARAASFDGSVIVGSSNTSVPFEEHAVRSVAGAAWEELSGDLANRSPAWAGAVSDDGATVVGGYFDPGGAAASFFWTAVEEETYFLSGAGAFISTGTGIASDGTLSALAIFDPYSSASTGYRVSDAGVALEIPALPPPSGSGYNGSGANAISEDGVTIVGVALSEAYRFTISEGSVGLGHLFPDSGLPWQWPGAEEPFSKAEAVSADGSIIVGWAARDAVEDDEYDYVHPEPERAFVWTSETGMRNLKTHLELRGVDLTGWKLTMATGVSNDGTVVVGNGINPSGQAEPWIANISGPIVVPAMPGPYGFRLLAIVLLLAGCRRGLRPIGPSRRPPTPYPASRGRR